MSSTDPNVAQEKELQKFVIIGGINPADKKPYVVKYDPTTGLLVNVSGATPSNLAAVEHTLITSTEEQIGTGTYPLGFTILADPDNIDTMKFGPLGSPTFPLAPGESVGMILSNLSKLYGIGTITDKVLIIGGI